MKIKKKDCLNFKIKLSAKLLLEKEAACSDFHRRIHSTVLLDRFHSYTIENSCCFDCFLKYTQTCINSSDDV